jgi:MFS family permease
MSEIGQQRERGVNRFSRMNTRLLTKIGRRPVATGIYHGWLVVGAVFVIGAFGFGIGFYGPGIYLVALRARYGWSAAEISFAITAYYLLGAMLTFFSGEIFECFGARMVVAAGAIAMACAVLMLALVTRLWQVYAAFILMAPGWAAMSGAAINIIIAPWFERRRGMAVKFAFNGPTAGGIVVVPLLTLLIARFGFAIALQAAVAVMVAIVIPIATLILRPKRAEERDRADRSDSASKSQLSEKMSVSEEAPWALSRVMRSARFQTISIPFALGLLAQVGLLTHQIAYLSPILGATGAAWAVSLTTSAAVVGRTITGFFIDKVDRRMTACGNFLVQIAGVAILAASRSAPMLYFGCVLFGLGVGNTSSLPSLIVHQEFPGRSFARIVSLIVAIDQFTFAFGPSLLGYLRQLTGSYTASLVACLVIEAAAAVIVILPVLARSVRGSRS